MSAPLSTRMHPVCTHFPQRPRRMMNMCLKATHRPLWTLLICNHDDWPEQCQQSKVS